MARRTADPRGLVADRVRSRPAPRVDPDSPRQREPSPGSRDGRLGVVRSSRAWLAVRVELPVGALFCVIDGPTRGRPWSATAARGELRRSGRRSAPVRAAPTPPRTRCRARTRRRAAAGHPTAARTFVRLHDQRVSAGDRRRGDHRNDPRAASADDAGQRRPRTLRLGPSDDRVGGGPRGASPTGARSRAAPPPDCISEPATADAAAAAQERQPRRDCRIALDAGADRPSRRTPALRRVDPRVEGSICRSRRCAGGVWLRLVDSRLRDWDSRGLS